MPELYFELEQDLYVPGRWYPDDPVDEWGEEVDPWMFRAGQPVVLTSGLKVPLHRPGNPVDFSATAMGVAPIVHSKVASVFAELAPSDVQLFPVQLNGQPEPYFLVNITRLVKCIDDSACKRVLYWTPEDGRPEKTGTYRNVVGLRIDKSKVGGAKVFRTWGWSIALIVSDDLKEALERTSATGMKFTEV
jgi:hypothetical protein